MNHLILRSHTEQQADRPRYMGKIMYCHFFQIEKGRELKIPWFEASLQYEDLFTAIEIQLE